MHNYIVQRNKRIAVQSFNCFCYGVQSKTNQNSGLKSEVATCQSLQKVFA